MEGKLQFLHAWCWWYRFWFLARFSSIYPFEETVQWCPGHSSSFPFIDFMVALGSILETAAATFMYCSTFRSHAPKTNSASSDKENPLPFPALWISLVLSYFLSSCPSLSFLWASCPIWTSSVSSLCYMAQRDTHLCYCTQMHNHL